MKDQMMPSRNLPPNLGPTRDVVMIDAELEQAYGPDNPARRYAMQADRDPREPRRPDAFLGLRPLPIQA